MEIQSNNNCCPKCKTTEIVSITESALCLEDSDCECDCAGSCVCCNDKDKYVCEKCGIVWLYCLVDKVIFTHMSDDSRIECHYCRERDEKDKMEKETKLVADSYENALKFDNTCCGNDKKDVGWFGYINKHNYERNNQIGTCLCQYCVDKNAKNIFLCNLMKVLVVNAPSLLRRNIYDDEPFIRCD